MQNYFPTILKLLLATFYGLLLGIITIGTNHAWYNWTTAVNLLAFIHVCVEMLLFLGIWEFTINKPRQSCCPWLLADVPPVSQELFSECHPLVCRETADTPPVASHCCHPALWPDMDTNNILWTQLPGVQISITQQSFVFYGPTALNSLPSAQCDKSLSLTGFPLSCLQKNSRTFPGSPKRLSRTLP